MELRVMQTSDVQHIYFCADRKYLFCTSAVMASILANSLPHSRQVFHIISDDIITADLAKLKELNNIKSCDIVLHAIKKEDFADYAGMDFGYISLGCFFRLKILDFAPEGVNKVLYLDGDMIVTAPLDELFDTDLEGYYAGVVEEKSAIQVQNLRLKSGRYFNSGMILFNLPALKGHNLPVEAAKWFKYNHEWMIMRDQDILNGIWDGKVKFVEQKFNVPSFVKDFANPVIIHYTGFVKKPWHFYCRHSLKNEWLKYAQLTAYRKSPFQLFLFKTVRFLSKIFYFAKDPTHKNYYILCVLGMNFGLGKKDNKHR